MNMKKPLILVTNDDGINAPGIEALVEVASELGEVVVVAPDSPQSGQGHAITISKPIWLKKVEVFDGIDSYECTGTPVDCVKLAKYVILKDRNPDLCVSGINHGSNASINIIYSGTMSAAMEASLEGINSIGFSLLNYGWDADFSATKVFVREIMARVLERGMGSTKLLNVNVPDLPESEIKGIRICRQADGRWVEGYMESKDPRGKPYYWLSGEFVNPDKGEDTDLWALENGYVSVVPSDHDLTNYKAIPELEFLAMDKSVVR
ncbi:MAG: 5'/3'-nucleotidase SurE [Bacteroidetes bacterium]|nr:MAG: 5'/3'-nucleotidase SurE [Bacteroidota bacterium]